MPKGRKTKKEAGRRRRGKKDVILNFTKRVTKKATATGGLPTISDTKQTACGGGGGGAIATIIKSNTKPIAVSSAKSAVKRARGKLSLATSSSEYGGSLSLPEKITQREFESTGQFFRRLDRLAAKAKVEASMEDRFDMTLPKEGPKKDTQSSASAKAKRGGVDLNLVDDSTEQRVQHSYNKKRVKR